MAITLARATVAQRTQLGKESTYGTPVPGDTRLPTLMWHPKPEVESTSYREQGRKFTSKLVPGKEWSSGTFDGAMSYGELPFLFASLFADSDPVDGGTGAHWTYTQKPSNSSPDVPAVYTLEHGDDNTAIQIPGVVVTEATLEIDRSDAKISGSYLGLAWVTGQMMTDDPTEVEDVPIEPGTIDVYLNTTFGAIGTTKLVKAMKSTFKLSGRWQPDWVLNSANSSYLDLVEAVPTAEATLMLQADATAMGLFATYRAGNIVYVQIKATGPIIHASVHYSAILNLPMQIKTLDEYSDEGGVYAIGFTFEPISDDTAGYPMELITVNHTAAAA